MAGTDFIIGEWTSTHLLLLYCASVLTLFLIANLKCLKKRKTNFWTNFPVKFPEDASQSTEEKDWYDVVIVGGGPGGSTAAYYLAKAGRRCLLLERDTFPRDKVCGDAVCKTAIEILIDMGIYESLLDEKLAKIADAGGFVSPGNYSYIGRSKEFLGEIPAALACKRIHLDNAIAMAAKNAGATLRDGCPVTAVDFNNSTGFWSVSVEGKQEVFKGRVLVCADGAPSKFANQLGIVKSPPDGTGARSYVEAGTHQFDCDGVIFYNKDLLPGYTALFRHTSDEVNYCMYILPGNPKVTDQTLAKWFEYIRENDPNVSKGLGPNAQFARMKTATLRLGAKVRSYGHHVLVVGDAAGMTDPMTGEGIHHAMEGGKIAAKFLDECVRHGNYDEAVMSFYEKEWREKFGTDFKWSMLFCQLIYRFPILLDAGAKAVQRKGDKFLAKWADIMTGRVPKINLMSPEFAVPITFELVLLIIQWAKEKWGNRKAKKID